MRHSMKLAAQLPYMQRVGEGGFRGCFGAYPGRAGLPAVRIISGAGMGKNIFTPGAANRPGRGPRP